MHEWQQALIVLGGYGFVCWPTGWIIGKLTTPFASQLRDDSGLKGGGKWIGLLERVLILTFVLINQFQPIGFLIAAKSILRFGEVTGDRPQNQNRKMAEYVIIGTMLSATVAIWAALAVKYLARI